MRRNSLVINDHGRRDRTVASLRDDGGAVLNQASSYIMLSRTEVQRLMEFLTNDEATATNV